MSVAYEFHELSDLFPMMSDSEYQELKNDIRDNGLMEPIWLYEGKIVDGRNRYKACTELGIEIQTKELNGDASPLSLVISLNLKRRHLNESQRAMIAARIANMPAHRPSNKSANLPTSIDQTKASELLNVGERSLRYAKEVQESGSPELITLVDSGEIAVSDAAKIADRPKDEQVEIIKKAKDMGRNLVAATRKLDIEKQRDAIESGAVIMPEGVFEVICIDPPWPYREDEDQPDYDPRGRRASSPYPEMSLDELANLEIPAADDSVLWLWTTHRFLRHSFDLLDAWGFQDRAILTWVKDRMGLGRWLRSQSEFCIMATKGKPVINLTNQTTIIHGKLREHSRKPDEFYLMVESLCIGRRLDYFSRERREGWHQVGNESEKFN